MVGPYRNLEEANSPYPVDINWFLKLSCLFGKKFTKRQLNLKSACPVPQFSANIFLIPRISMTFIVVVKAMSNFRTLRS